MTLPSRYVERSVRLSVGVEVHDALRHEVAPRAELRVEGLVDHERVRALRRRRTGYLSDLLAAPLRHPSGRYALLYAADTDDHVDLRLYDGRRRFVPRRLRLPVIDESAADDRVLHERTRHVGLYPGAAYPHSGNATGMRGRVVRAGEPIRWGRVEARRGSEIVGRAHTDDRGEFLLLLDPDAAPGVELPADVELEVHVFARPADPTPSPADLPSLDPLWDLPLETVSGTAPDDEVSAGRQRPPELTATASRAVVFRPGAVLTGTAPFNPS